MVWILWLYLINTLLMLIVAIREVRRPAKALNWLAICLVFPVIGFVFYLSITNPIRISRERLTFPHNQSDTLPDSFSRSASVIAQSLRHLSVYGLRNGRVQVLMNGIETYERLMESIKNAKNLIDLEYYIYRDDQVGRRITDLLIERAKAGVRVRFVRDGWGSRKFPRSQIIRMMDAGIECRTVFPLRFPWILSNWNYRDHCKIVVIDGKEAFTGGINIGYEYTGLKPNVGFWRDTHLRIVGEAAVDMHTIFKIHWNIASPERIQVRGRKNTLGENKQQKPVEGPSRHPLHNITPQGIAVSGQGAEWAAELGTLGGNDANTATNTEALRNSYIQTFEGNPGIPTQVIREVYFICLTQALKTLDITTPYFVPDADIIMAIKTAVARGVRVRLLVPHHSDQKFVDLASRTYFGELVEAGVHIYQYNKGKLHAKVMIIDGEIAEVGAANYDMRSFRLNYEVCEVIYSTDVARELTKQFERDLTDSVPMRIEDLLHRSLPQRIMEQGARLLSPMI
ncbi:MULTISPECIES: phospholipase D-like domain-containing protein [unclassified Paenibacillus]|uniref:phospholipase D-like domain-containing protein n=1 Tax=unclassified Paenibacillus TaxID=185978 RepID=UPI001AE9A445|nr:MULTISPECIES: phospholipase D-like domain-containing protein [unclassified Paenibacillus]MBP1155121.1 phosphatidylserine/phosphatidylglycerophosphate/cardiolipin synthase-like enzyme [Paenibacillus sp. PvP091]MBP1169495.1 phosphatidylserine/phosphatidylglycerophosphate/cardiolipin synthase-like enzyme [Paenibacillus sp. PvR098]MBP2440523.1 phosphatidylserine/phosphatidylglycerophosphate/cardiolipin synthase-like enzyme [Paenibacillus sp. PvP052]